MQQFIHLPANIQCSPQRSKQPQHPFPIGYLEIRFLQQAPGLPVVFLSLAICGTQGGIQVWSLQVTITAPLLLLWRSSSFVSSQRSHRCAALQIPLPKLFFLIPQAKLTFHEPHSSALYMQECSLFIYDQLILWPSDIPSFLKNCVYNKHQIPHENTVCDAQNVFLVDTTNIFFKMHAYVFTPICWGAIFDVSCSVFTFVVESVVINC